MPEPPDSDVPGRADFPDPVWDDVRGGEEPLQDESISDAQATEVPGENIVPSQIHGDSDEPDDQFEAPRGVIPNDRNP